jgi:hypothetical protein
VHPDNSARSRWPLPEDIAAFHLAAQRLLGASDSSHAAIEDTLTSGYAHVLALEAERRRLERLILAAATTPEEVERGQHLGGLANEFWRIDALLRELHETLDRLRRHYRSVRGPRPAASRSLRR